jgi:hypothetical protein
MSPHSRLSCLLLLLIVLVSHASLTLHVNSHVLADQQPCELCTHYSNFEHAAPPAFAIALTFAFYVPEQSVEAARVPAPRPSLYRQRAPPHAA